MDFAWFVDALHRGLKVTREAWKEFPQMYLQLAKGSTDIRLHTECGFAPWKPSYEELLDVADWKEYVEPKKEPAADYISLSSEKETRLPNNPSYDDEQDSHEGKLVEEPDLDVEANKAIALVARNIAENLVELLRNPSVLRLLQKTDVPLSKEDTNHV